VCPAGIHAKLQQKQQQEAGKVVTMNRIYSKVGTHELQHQQWKVYVPEKACILTLVVV
jgi:hypothetical protein